MNIPDKNSYQFVFDQRGKWYHQAMEQIPDVRKREFKLLFDKIGINTHDKILDFPSGGGYLKNFLPNNVDLTELEVSESFAKIHNIPLGSWDYLPFQGNSFNLIFCCAALHHVNNEIRQKYFSESYRILVQGGLLSLADADANGNVAPFLNGYVNENNSSGHHGDFLDERSAQNFAGNLFEVVRNEICKYNWFLTTEKSSSLKFIKLMFGLDKANEEDLFEQLSKQLNLRKNKDDRYIIDWSLRYIILKKK